MVDLQPLDPLAEKYYSISPYAYVANNPLKFIHPTGMDLHLTGEEAKAAFVELQKAASRGLTLSIYEDKVSYTVIKIIH